MRSERRGGTSDLNRSLCRWIWAAAAVSLLGVAELRAQQRDAGGVPAPTASLERGRAVYVLNHCHFCHGVDLTRSVMGATNLVQSRMLGADQDGKLIRGVVRAGLPNLQTAMPSYRELTDEQMVELARYLHYLRQLVKFRELSAPASTQGDAAAGRAYFEKAGSCGSCHSLTADLAGVAGKYDAATLRARLLRPGPVAPPDGEAPVAGHAAHLRLLENYSPADVDNLLAYLREPR